jgi:ectoine hydroxylase-related dioxygenase (phytanoyl-CoA dioxygenase family)
MVASNSISGILTEEQRAAHARDGFLVFRGLLSTQEAEEIREAFMTQAKDGPVEGLSEIRRPHADGRTGYDPSDPLAYYPRMMHPHRHHDKEVGRIAMKYMLDRRIEQVLSELMGERPYAAQSMFYFKPPGARGQDFHQDNFYLKVKPGTCMAALVAIDRCDEQNGGMMCVPDTHAYEIQCPERSDPKLYFTTEHVAIPEGKSAVLPVMEPGDVLFFNGSTIHGSGPNHSKDRFRRSLIFHYFPQSTKEIARHYETMDFNGNRLEHVIPNEDGGPCGTFQDAPSPH